MTYEETLQRIHEFNVFGSKLGLERMEKLLEILGNPQDSLSFLHVAGTNGKGSVCRYLYSVLEENGYRTGLYTSPYIEKFTERIEFHGEQISEKELTEITEEVLSGVEQMLALGLESPTEFEVVTAIAFLYYYKKQADFVVLEVGLGGRGDSTNAIKTPVATVVTSISFDHMEQLGDTLSKIAWEKAGIIKPKVPILFAVKDRWAAEVICSVAEGKEAPIYDLFGTSGRKAIVGQLDPIEKGLTGYRFNCEVLGKKYKKIELCMVGMHQVENAVCALSTLQLLQSQGVISLEAEKIRSGMKNAKQIGRFEIISENPCVIIDGAHNEDGVRSLTESLLEHFKGKKILCILGILKDKEVDRMLARLLTLSADFAVTEPENPRRMKATELCEKIQSKGHDCICLGEWENAVSYGKEKSGEYDLVIYAGSLYLIGKIREAWREQR